MVRRRATADRVLVSALATTFLLCLYGVTVRQMHPDALAFLPLFAPGKPPFDPGWFHKPPFYPYCNYVLAVLPLSAAARALRLSADVPTTAQIVWSRVLLAGALLGSAGLVFAITRRAYGTAAARVVAVVFVTSAGMVAFVHQLTADVPVMWWMLVAFSFADAIARDERTSNYVLAGFCTGLAAATKYNGVGVGVAIVVAHVMRALTAAPGPRTWRAWRAIALDSRLALGLVTVPVGFVLANPFAILDYRTFKDDFHYNYMTAPVYEGQTGHSWGTFFLRIVDLIGAPAFVAFAVAGAIATWLVVRRRRLSAADATFWSTLAVCALYYVTFAPFARLETRFVLPIVPFWMMLSAPCWARWRRPTTLAALVGAIVAYNVVCSAWVGARFLADPRSAAAAWVREHVRRDASVEYDIYSPAEKGGRVRAVTMPFVTGRERLFEHVFPGNAFINGSDATRRAAEEQVRWYAVDALTRRAPDYIMIDSLYYDRFVEPGLRSDLYPSMREYFRALLAGEVPYRIVFDRRSPAVPAVIYPREIDFLDNRATICAKDTGVSARSR